MVMKIMKYDKVFFLWHSIFIRLKWSFLGFEFRSTDVFSISFILSEKLISYKNVKKTKHFNVETLSRFHSRNDS